MRNKFCSVLISIQLLGLLPGASGLAASAPQITWTKDLKVIGSVSIAPNGDLIFIGSDAKLHRTDAGGAEKWNFVLATLAAPSRLSCRAAA